MKLSADPQTPAQRAHALLSRIIKRVQLSKTGFVSKIPEWNYDINQFNNLSKTGRQFPRDLNLLRSIVRELGAANFVERGITALELLALLEIIEAPFAFLEPLARDLPPHLRDEFQLVLAAKHNLLLDQLNILPSLREQAQTLRMAMSKLAHDQTGPSWPDLVEIPFRRSPYFRGRETLIEEVGKTLRYPQAVVVLRGAPGIGKTRLAVQAAYRYANLFEGGVFWISFADPPSIPGQIARFGGQQFLKLHRDFEMMPLERRVRLVLRAWSSLLPRLLIFDNCEDEALIEQWCPEVGESRVLITSRKSWSDHPMVTHELLVPPLARSDSTALLWHLHPTTTQPGQLDTLAQLVGDLPLALTIIGRYLAAYPGDSLADYVSTIERVDTEQIDRLLVHPAFTELEPGDYSSNLIRAFALSSDRLRPHDLVDQVARQALARIAILAPGIPTPTELLSLLLPVEQRARLEAACKRLMDLGFIEREADATLRIHQLTASYVRAALTSTADYDAVEATLCTYVQKLEMTSQTSPQFFHEHIRLVVQRAQRQNSPRALDLADGFAWQLYLTRELREAETLIKAVIEARSALAQQHPQQRERQLALAESRERLGLIYQFLRRPLDSERLFLLVRTTRDHYGDLHNAAITRSNLGVLYMYGRGKPQLGYRYLREALAMVLVLQRRIRDGQLPPEDLRPTLARFERNLGYAALLTAHQAEARRYLWRSLANYQLLRHEASSEQAHAIVYAQLLIYLGHLALAEGQVAEARAWYQQTLDLRRSIRQPYDLDIVESHWCFGLASLVEGDFERARDELEEAIKLSQQATFEDLVQGHMYELLRIYRDLGAAYLHLHQYERAGELLERALRGFNAMINEPSYEAAMAYEHLATLAEHSGDRATTLLHLQTARQAYLNSLGAEHPRTQGVVQRLAAIEPPP